MKNPSKTLLDKCTKIPVNKAVVPFTGARVWVDCYWIVIEENILFYNKFSPQCNPNKNLTEKLRDNLYPNAEVRHFPLIYGLNHN